MESENETFEDIVAEMRNESHAGDESCLEWVSSKLRSYADRIEAAHKREREAGAEAAQVCGEIGEMIGMEATREKPSQVGNAAKMRDALEAVVKVGYPHNFQKEAYHIREYCYEITTAIKKCFASLAEPPRNCDRPECATSKAAQDVWRKEEGGKTAYYEWLLATYTEGGKQ